MRKRLLCMVLAIIVGFSGVNVTAYATDNTPVSEVLQEQTAGAGNQSVMEDGVPPITLTSISTANGRIENDKGGIEWAITADGVLTVTGKGDIAEDNIGGTVIPWSGMNFTSAVIRLEEVTDLSYFFADCKNLRSVDFSGTDTGFVTDMSYMFNDCWELQSVNLTSFDTADVENMQGMFSGCKNLRTITWDKNKFDTGNVTNMNSMFMGCIHLTTVDFSGFKTSKVTDMSSMFRACAKLVNLDITSFNTSSVTNMANMFWECTGLARLNLGSFNTARVTSMREMFKNCSDLTELNVSGFNTANVTDMTNMFGGCTDLKELDLSSFDMSKVTEVGTAFIGGKDFWDADNTTLEKMRTPRNLSQSIKLPATAGEIWYQLGGGTVTNLPQSADSVLVQKNKVPEKGLTVYVSDTSTKPVITVIFDGEADLESFSLKIDGQEVLGTDAWKNYYDEATKKLTWQIETELPEGQHTLVVEVQDKEGNKFGTPIEKTFHVVIGGVDPDPGPGPEPPLPEGEIISKVIVVVNEKYIRVRAWSPYDNVTSVQAQVLEEYTSGQTETVSDGNMGDGTIYPMNLTNGYYTCLIPRVREDLAEVTATVTATNNAGLSHTADPVVVTVDSTLDDDKVVNDLWVRFLDGEGAENNEYIYTGKAIKPAVEVYEGTTLLTLKKDYTISYKNNKNAGTGLVVVKGRGAYNKSANAEFTILPKDITNEDPYETAALITIDALAAVEKNKVQKITPVIKYGKMKLSGRKNRDFTVTYPDTESGAYQKAGTWNVEVKGNGNYTGEVTLEYNIGGKLAKSLKVSKIPNQNYNNGDPVEVSGITVKDGKNVLTLDEHYTIEFINNVNAGTASAVITGIGPAYVGAKVVNFKILGTAIKKASITGLPKSVEYTGEAQVPEIQLSYSGKTLVEGEDYDVVFSKNVTAGTASVQFTGRGGFTGTMKKTFKITPFDGAANAQQRMEIETSEAVPYAKGGAKPETTITFNGDELVEGTDYKLSYKANKAVGTGTVKISFKKNFKNSVSKTFKIEQQDIELLNSTTQDRAVSSKKNSWKSTVTVLDLDGKKLVANKDFEKVTTYYTDEACETVASAETYPVETEIWVKIIGKGNYKGELITSYKIKPNVITKARVKIAAQPYTSYPVTLEYSDITSVKVGKQILVAEKDYEIVEDSYVNNIKKGKASVTLRGIGDNYGGTITVKFTIGPKFFLWRWLPMLDPANNN